MQVVAKFKCSSIKAAHYDESGPAQVEVELNAVTSSDPSNPNAQWSKWTPSGRLTMVITNPAAADAFKAGREYLITFNEAPKPA